MNGRRRRSSILWLLGLLTLCGSATAQGISSASTAPVFTRQTIFAIPFRVDRLAPAGTELKEIQLYVSIDAGATWAYYSSVPPLKSQFLFHADRDGIYWFALRTIDTAGHAQPAEVRTPGLAVVVDTSPPRLRLDAQRGPGGQVAVRWYVHEAHLAADTFSLQYRCDSNQPWQPVAVAKEQLLAGMLDRSGEVAWLPPAGAARVEIRAEASDTAGNRDVCHAQVDGGAAGPVAVPAGTPRAQTVAMPPPGPGTQQDGWKVAAQSASYARQAQLPASGENSVAQPPLAASTPGQGTAAALAASTPAVPQMVNSYVFELEYSVNSQVAGAYVELWGTADRGATWTSFGIDSDGRSPIVARAPSEGLYGFRFMVRSPSGPITPAPRPGDGAEIWLGVDVTRPRVSIVSALPAADRSAAYDIGWQADDLAMAPHPVTLSVASAPAGPWNPIATGLEPAGSFRWRVPGDARQAFYLRVDARDAAGNVGVAISERPVTEATWSVVDAPAIIQQAGRAGPRRIYFR